MVHLSLPPMLIIVSLTKGLEIIFNSRPCPYGNFLLGEVVLYVGLVGFENLMEALRTGHKRGSIIVVCLNAQPVGMMALRLVKVELAAALVIVVLPGGKSS